MALRAPKKSAIERRLKELEKQSALVRDDIKTLSKVIRNPENIEALPRLKSRELPAVPAPTRKDPASLRRALVAEPPLAQPEPVAPPAPEPAPEAPPPEDVRTKRVPPIIIPASEVEKAEPEPKNKAMLKDERFANYFSSGNFLGAGGLKQEKNVQRNKAIFMIVVVIGVAYSVFRLWFR